MVQNRITRRDLLVNASSVGIAIAIGSGNTDGAFVSRSTVALDEVNNVAGDLWIGPEGALDQVDPSEGAMYVTSDTQVEYYGDGAQWIEMGVGAPENPVPSVHAETSFNTEWISTRYLDGDGTDESGAIERMIEDAAAEGPTRIRWEAGTYRVESPIRPETDGTAVVIECIGDVVIDGTGLDASILDLSGAENVYLRNLTIEGSESDGFGWSLETSDGFHGEDITLDGGAGGMNITGENVIVEGIESRGHRQSDNGYAAAIHARGDDTEHFHVRDFVVEDSDRGIEIEDGASHWTVENGVVRDIDNSRAADPGAVFVLDCHVHSGKDPVVDGTYRDVLVKDCASGLSVSEHEDGLISDITVENVRIENVTRGAHARLEADVTVEDTTIVAREGSSDLGCQIRGGEVAVRGGKVIGPGSVGISITQGDRTDLKTVDIEGTHIDGSGNTKHGLQFASVGATPCITNVRIENTTDTSVRAGEDELSADGWGAIITDVETDNDIDIAEGGNRQVLVRGSRIGGSLSLPPKSATENNILGGDSGDGLQAKQDAAEGGKLVLDEGEYVLPEDGLMVGSNIVIEGAGMGNTVLKRHPDDDDFRQVETKNAPRGVQNVTLRDLTIDANYSAEDGSLSGVGGALSLSGDRIRLERVRVLNGKRHNTELCQCVDVRIRDCDLDTAQADDVLAVVDGAGSFAGSEGDSVTDDVLVIGTDIHNANGGEQYSNGLEIEQGVKEVVLRDCQLYGNDGSDLDIRFESDREVRPGGFRAFNCEMESATNGYDGDWQPLQHSGKATFVDCEMPNSWWSPYSAMEVRNCSLEGIRIDAEGARARHVIRDSVLKPIRATAGVSYKNPPPLSDLYIEGCLFDGSEHDGPLVVVTSWNDTSRNVVITHNKFEDVSSPGAIELGGDGDIRPSMAVVDNIISDDESTFIADNSKSSNRVVRLRDNLRRDDTSDKNIGWDQVDEDGPARIALNGVVRVEFDEETPDATEYDVGDRVVDTRDGKAWLILDNTTSNGHTRL